MLIMLNLILIIIYIFFCIIRLADRVVVNLSSFMKLHFLLLFEDILVSAYLSTALLCLTVSRNTEAKILWFSGM